MSCKRLILFLLVSSVSTNSFAAGNSGSFLSAQKFPSTFADLSFSERMAVLKEGYEPFEIEFDAKGNCISGCAFQGMKLEDTVKYYERQTEIANLQAESLRAQHPEWTILTQPVQPTKPIYTHPATQQIQPHQASQTNTATVVPAYAGYCPNNLSRLSNFSPGQTAPFGYPLEGSVRITSEYGLRNIANGSKYHGGVDLAASNGTPVFSTISGTVVKAKIDPKSGCGNQLKIQSPDGFAIMFCHLQDILVNAGDTVSAGCMVAKSGHSGIGKAGKPYAPHLHYEVFNSAGQQFNPVKPVNYLNNL